MTTPTPAQQLKDALWLQAAAELARARNESATADQLEADADEIIRDMGRKHAPTLRRALAALDAVEGASKGIVRERGGSLAAIHYVIGMLPPDAAFPALGDNVLIIPADAVEVSRG